MQRTDRCIGAGLALLAAAVMWTARDFPKVPGQAVGAAFLPMLVGAGLLLCGLGLVARSFRASAYAGVEQVGAEGGESIGAALVVIGIIVAYCLLADRLGFLIVAPPCLLLLFRVLRVSLGRALLWSVLATAIVHLGFYKLLRVPLPWGLLRPFY